MNYDKLLKKIEYYKTKYAVSTIGFSEQKRKLFVIEKFNGKDKKTAILVGSIHAREHISADLLCKFLDDGLFDNVLDFNVAVIPMINPDGVEIETQAISNLSEKRQRFLLNTNKNSKDFSMWKANANGVDLNNNFDAEFDKFTNKKTASASGYAGPYAFSENESRALAKFTKNVDAFFTISYHSKGEEIYFNFHQDKFRLKRDAQIAEYFANHTGYFIKNVENVSSGGYKDWCIEKLKIPAITIELGSDELLHPISTDHLDEIYEKNKTICEDLIFAYKVFNKYL